MSSFAVRTIFTARDKVSKAFKKMGKSSKRFGDVTSRSFNKASRSGSRFRDVMKGIIGANLIGRGFSLAARGVRSLVTEFSDMDDAIFAASAKFADINPLIAEGQKKMDGLRKAARDVAGMSEFTPAAAASGLDFLALAGFNSVQALKALPRTVDFATAAQADLARASDILTDSIGAFGLRTKDAVQLEKNLIRTSDALTLVMGRTNTPIEDLFESIKKGAAVFTAAGQSLETFVGLVGIMADAGIKGSESGTALRNAILSLVKPVPEAAKLLEKMQVKIGDKNGNVRDFVDILADLEVGLSKMGELEGIAAIKTIFEKRGTTGILLLLKRGTKSIRAWRKQVEAAGGSTELWAKIMRMSFGNKMLILVSAVLEKGLQVADAFGKKSKDGIGRFTEAIREMNVKPIIRFLTDLVTIVKNLVRSLEPAAKMLGPIISVALIAITKTLKLFSPMLGGLIATVITLTIAMKAWAAIQVVINLLMTANPVGLLITGIGLLTGAIVFLVQNFDTLKENMASIWDGALGAIKGFVLSAIKLLKPYVMFVLQVGKVMAVTFGSRTTLFDDIAMSIDKFESRLEKSVRKVSQLQKDNLARIANIRREQGLMGTGVGFVSLRSLRPATFNSRGEKMEPVDPDQFRSRNEFTFNGRLDIANAPKGSRIESDSTGQGNFDMGLAGVNP